MKIKEMTNQQLVAHFKEWRQDSINDNNQLTSLGKPMTDITYLAAVVKGLHDDNYYLLGIVQELMERLLVPESGQIRR